MSLSPAQLKYLENIGEQSYTKPEPESQKFRTTMQGATLGFADEIEAFARSMVNTRPYEEIRDEIRKLEHSDMGLTINSFTKNYKNKNVGRSTQGRAGTKAGKRFNKK